MSMKPHTCSRRQNNRELETHIFSMQFKQPRSMKPHTCSSRNCLIENSRISDDSHTVSTNQRMCVEAHTAAGLMRAEQQGKQSGRVVAQQQTARRFQGKAQSAESCKEPSQQGLQRVGQGLSSRHHIQLSRGGPHLLHAQPTGSCCTKLPAAPANSTEHIMKKHALPVATQAPFRPNRLNSRTFHAGASPPSKGAAAKAARPTHLRRLVHLLPCCACIAAAANHHGRRQDAVCRQHLRRRKPGGSGDASGRAALGLGLL